MLMKVEVTGANVETTAVWSGRRWIEFGKAARPKLYRSRTKATEMKARAAAEGSHVWWFETKPTGKGLFE